MTRYELIERIAVGTLAEIFRGKAVAAGGFEKPVAIKRMLPHLGQDRRFVQALIAEAKILSQLRHRNIVQIFDVGLGDDGQYFLVMEYVDGMDLAGIQKTLESRRKRLPLDIALHVGAEICEALEHAHAALAPDGQPMRVIHRDVAPSNVLVSRHGEIKLTDFGLARRPDEVTGHGNVRAKFGYLSPEAAAGQPIDTRSDVFSAAVLVYELTLGRRLFSQLSDLEALRQIREGAIARPQQMDPSLPRALDDILMAALVRDPERRLATAGELGARLRGLRYSLDSAAGDPSQELARILAGVQAAGDAPAPAPDEAATAAERPRGAGGNGGNGGHDAGKRRRAPASSMPFGKEPTYVSLQPVDLFGDDRDGTGVIKARQLLDRFEEEETRLASVPGVDGADARWREPQDTFGLGGTDGGPRETSPTGIYLEDRTVDTSETGEQTFTGTPRQFTDDADESTKVLSPALLARGPDRRDGPRGKGGRRPSAPPPLPGTGPVRAKAAPPPVPAARAPARARLAWPRPRRPARRRGATRPRSGSRPGCRRAPRRRRCKSRPAGRAPRFDRPRCPRWWPGSGGAARGGGSSSRSSRC
ncbi:MAG: serine/threonine protein kinase [Kofleriaceae bacterium]|nr:serine/threonine protein kinase [Kofleriaceae bacterium]